MRPYNVRKNESKWQQAWDKAGCHRAPLKPGPDKYFIHDSAPSPNGPLHLGHVRVYVIGDMTARYHRLLGKSVLYHTGFDAFGLPVEQEAIENNVSPRELAETFIATMSDQLKQLGISYDWSTIPSTCDPECYVWTQWLFLEMFDAGIVEQRNAPVSYCPRCKTTLARIQIEKDCCWRCDGEVETRQLPQWFVITSKYNTHLRDTLEERDGWNAAARNVIAGLLDDLLESRESRSGRIGDWLVSRQRSWGTPIPLVHCEHCGVVRVPEAQLPVILPDDLDWASGSGALGRCDEFIHTSCPKCESPARRETDTLDCFYDDMWCHLQALALRAKSPGITRENLADWLPADEFQSGFDTIIFLHLYRFLGAFLKERGLIDDPELVTNFTGNELVLAGGRKMSKHLGNAVDPQDILEEYGGDALRIAMHWAAGPHRAVEWKSELLGKAESFLESTYALVVSVRDRKEAPSSGQDNESVSKAAGSLRATCAKIISRVGGFIESCRPNAALEELASLQRAIDRFAEKRIPTVRLSPADGEVLDEVVRDYLIAMAPFAPHLAEECWSMLGNKSLICCERWPRSA